MKKLLILASLPISFLWATVPPAIAGIVEPMAVNCWFFRGEQLELSQTCTYSGASWAGGGGSRLEWEDGVITLIEFGLQGHGERPCPEVGVDGVCGEWSFRHPDTLERISEAEFNDRTARSLDSVRCVDVNNKSICWMR